LGGGKRGTPGTELSSPQAVPVTLFPIPVTTGLRVGPVESKLPSKIAAYFQLALHLYQLCYYRCDDEKCLREGIESNIVNYQCEEGSVVVTNECVRFGTIRGMQWRKQRIN
jgi:hypothetical protein